VSRAVLSIDATVEPGKDTHLIMKRLRLRLQLQLLLRLVAATKSIKIIGWLLLS